MLGRSQLLEDQPTATLERVLSHLGGEAPKRSGRDGLLYALLGVSTNRLDELVDALSASELRAATKGLLSPALTALSDDRLRRALKWRWPHGAPVLSSVCALARRLDAHNAFLMAHVGPPATSEEVRAVEARFGVSLPRRLTDLYSQEAGASTFTWTLMDAAADSPQQIDLDALTDEELDLFEGRLSWDLPGTQRVDPDYFVEGSLRLFPLFVAENGDCVCAAIRAGRLGEILWWSHDDDDRHGRVLAADLDTWMKEWRALRWLNPSASMITRCFGADGAEREVIARRLDDLLEADRP